MSHPHFRFSFVTSFPMLFAIVHEPGMWASPLWIPPVSEILPQVICGFPVSRLWPLKDGTHSKRALAIDQACYLQQAIRPSDM